jgi:hypothetical protein
MDALIDDVTGFSPMRHPFDPRNPCGADRCRNLERGSRSARRQYEPSSIQKQCSRTELTGRLAGRCPMPVASAVKKGRRYRYYLSAAPVTGTGTDLGQGWAGMPPAPEMSCAPRQLRFVPHSDVIPDEV